MSEFVLKHSVSLPDYQVAAFMQNMHGIGVESKRNGGYTFECKYLVRTEEERLAHWVEAVPLTLVATREGFSMEHDKLVFTSAEVGAMIAKLLSFIMLHVTAEISDRSVTLDTHRKVDVWDVAKSLLETRGVNV